MSRLIRPGYHLAIRCLPFVREPKKGTLWLLECCRPEKVGSYNNGFSSGAFPLRFPIGLNIGSNHFDDIVPTPKESQILLRRVRSTWRIESIDIPNSTRPGRSRGNVSPNGSIDYPIDRKGPVLTILDALAATENQMIEPVVQVVQRFYGFG